MEKIKYSQEWYETVYHDDKWLSNSFLEEYKRQDSYRQRLRDWFAGINLNNKKYMLEIAFNDGKTAYWMKELYPHLIIDMFDFSKPAIEKMRNSSISHLFRDIFYSDVQNIQKPDNYYDIITCIDNIEHLPENIYEQMIKEIYRVLKQNGYVFIYVGETNQPEHINLKPDLLEVIRDFRSNGFELLDNRNKMLWFEKNNYLDK